MHVVNLSSYAELVIDDTSFWFRRVGTNEPLDWYLTNVAFSGALQQRELMAEMVELMQKFHVPRVDVDMDEAEGYRSSEAAVVGVSLITHVYPIIAQLFPHEIMSDNFYSTAPVMSDRMIRASRTNSVESFVNGLFGEYRKDLVKAVLSCRNIQALFWSALFAGHVPVDWIIDFIKRPSVFADLGGLSIDDELFDEMLSMLNRYQVRRLMTAKGERADGEFGVDTTALFNTVEAARLLKEIPASARTLPGKVTGTSLHDHFAMLSRDLKPDTVFDVPKEIVRTDGTEVNGFSVKVLTSRKQFVDAGEALENCAGSTSYTVGAADGKLALVRFDMVGLGPKYLMELSRNGSSWQVKQLFGPKNTELPSEDDEAIREFVEREINA